MGAFGAFLFAVARRKLTWRSLLMALLNTTTAMILAILIGAILLGYFMAVTKVPMTLDAFFAGLPISPTLVWTQ
jgi:TRAP-type C4-dicarboxylate transport system permease large subunit